MAPLLHGFSGQFRYRYLRVNMSVMMYQCFLRPAYFLESDQLIIFRYPFRNQMMFSLDSKAMARTTRRHTHRMASQTFVGCTTLLKLAGDSMRFRHLQAPAVDKKESVVRAKTGQC